jgi:hypothetical protein
MKSLNNKSWGLIFSGFLLLFLMACASEPVNIDLPQNHPANPEAQETAFMPPSDPFQNHLEMESGAGSSMTEKKHSPSHQHQMTHQMDQMSEDSISKPESTKEKQDHQH